MVSVEGLPKNPDVQDEMHSLVSAGPVELDGIQFDEDFFAEDETEAANAEEAYLPPLAPPPPEIASTEASIHLTAIYSDRYGQLVRLAALLVRNMDAPQRDRDPEDYVQDTFRKLFTTYDQPGKKLAHEDAVNSLEDHYWNLTRAALKGMIINRVRPLKNRLQQDLPRDEGASETDAFDTFLPPVRDIGEAFTDEADVAALFNNAGIKPEDRLLFWKAHVLGIDRETLAREHGMTNGSMRIKLHRIANRLRKAAGTAETVEIKP